MKENETENFDVHRKSARKMSSTLFKMVHDSIILVGEHLFCFESNKFNNFLRKFPGADLILGSSRISVSEPQIFVISK